GWIHNPVVANAERGILDHLVDTIPPRVARSWRDDLDHDVRRHGYESLRRRPATGEIDREIWLAASRSRHSEPPGRAAAANPPDPPPDCPGLGAAPRQRPRAGIPPPRPPRADRRPAHRAHPRAGRPTGPRSSSRRLQPLPPAASRQGSTGVTHPIGSAGRDAA